MLQAFVAAAISTALALYLLPRQQNPATRALIGLVLSVAIWSLCYAMELQATGLPAKLSWVRAEYLGAAWVGVLFFRFAMVLSGNTRWYSGPRNVLLMGFPVLTLLLVFTNGHHHLMWHHAWIITDGPLPTVAYQRGLGFWSHIGVSYTLLAIASIDLFRTFLASGKLERRSFGTLMVGLAVPWLCNILYIFQFRTMP